MADLKNSILLFGGRSDERLVSVASAQNLAAQFPFSEHWFIDLSGSIHRVPKSELLAHQKAFEVQFKAQAKAFASSLQDAVPFLKDKIVYLGLHGTEGEDGTIQTLFEKNKIPFTGSGSTSSQNCFDKLKAKKIVSSHGCATAAGLNFGKLSSQETQKLLSDFFEKNGPMVVKPVASGSSFGLHILPKFEMIAKAASEIASSSYNEFLVEKFISGRELTVGVYESKGQLKPLPASEVVLQTGHSFDYQGKYLGRGTKEVTPAQISDSQMQAAQKLAMEAHQALQCAGYTRTDMILTDHGPIYLETNTLPGMTKASFIPQQLEAAHITVADFMSEQLQIALDRYR